MKRQMWIYTCTEISNFSQSCRSVSVAFSATFCRRSISARSEFHLVRLVTRMTRLDIDYVHITRHEGIRGGGEERETIFRRGDEKFSVETKYFEKRNGNCQYWTFWSALFFSRCIFQINFDIISCTQLLYCNTIYAVYCWKHIFTGKCIFTRDSNNNCERKSNDQSNCSN